MVFPAKPSADSLHAPEEIFSAGSRSSAPAPDGACEMTRASDAESPTVAWRGDFAALHSLAHVNREVTRKLRERGLLVRQEERGAPSSPADVVVTHGWPPVLDRPAARRWIAFQPWEFGSMPSAWLAPFRDVADEVWTYTTWNRERYLEDGLAPDRVAVVPLGVGPEFRPGAPPLARLRDAAPDRLRFLFVGGTVRRKGIDVLLAAWRRAFTAEDPVALIIKDFCKQGAYRGQTQEAAIAAAAAEPGVAPIVYCDDDLSAAELPGLYTACDVLVHPYRGEGFGLPILEALACGLPAIVTRGGAADDFCDAASALFIAAEKRAVRPAEPLVRDGYLLEPSAGQLAGLLRLAAAHPERMRAMGLAGAARVAREWTWERSAEVAARRIAAVLCREVSRARELPASV
jgi:glycosyltransferase involved in cell wall biosynthesis